MALNFPNSPTNGQLYTDSASGNRWVWDSGNTCWVSTSTFTQTITVASSAPGSPVTGQLWWNKDYGRLLVYYTDDNTSQWVDASPSDYTSQLAYGVANAAFAKANNALANTSGVSFAGDLYIPGNMGVGTSSPLIKLDVNGGMRVQSISNPASGLGMELSYDSTQGIIQAFTNRATLATAPIYFTGGQIKFPPTQNASSDANTLDDYEEGTWTPNINSNNGTGTFTQKVGYYIKIGRKVTAWFFVDAGNSLAAGTTQYVTGLPFSIYGYAGTSCVGQMGTNGPTTRTQQLMTISANRNIAYVYIGGTQETTTISFATGVLEYLTDS